jgi:hypothetical protein
VRLKTNKQKLSPAHGVFISRMIQYAKAYSTNEQLHVTDKLADVTTVSTHSFKIGI